MANKEDANNASVLQARQEEQPYLPSDPSAISLSYLARISSDVYESNDEGKHQPTTSLSSGNIEIGPDRFSIHEHVEKGNQESASPDSTTTTTTATTTRTLFVAICGTSSPLQHVMNVMPHAYKGMQLVERALSTKDSSQNNNNSNNERASVDRDAYEEGFVQGWQVPASNIYEEVLRICSSAEKDNQEPIDLNEKYDRIVFTGHSRGGLLAYHASVFCKKGTNSQPPYRGALGVVGFGMPPPLSPPSDPLERSVCVRSVLSVFHTHDPASNGSVLKFPNSWNPAHKLSVTLSPEEENERARKQQEQQALRSASSIRGGSGFWGAVGNLVQTAVSAVGDTASELASNIEEYHSIGGYVRKIKNGNGSLLEKDVTLEAASLTEAVSSFVVEKRDQWVLVFPEPPNGEQAN